MPPVFVVAAALLMSSEEFYQAWNTCSAGVPTRHVAYADACGISQVPWRSVLCLCPAPRPRPSRQDLALAILSMLPSGHPGRRPQRVHNIEANTGPQHPLSTLHERRRRLPCKTRFRLAGCASTGRGLNPLDRFERFQVTSHSPFQDFACRKGGLCQAPVRRTRAGAGLSRPLYPSRRPGKLSSHPARRRPGRLHLERLPPSRQDQGADARCRRIHSAVPIPRRARTGSTASAMSASSRTAIAPQSWRCAVLCSQPRRQSHRRRRTTASAPAG